MITIDNVNYDVGIVKITRKVSTDADSLGITLDGRKHYNVKGTYFDYDVQFNTKAMNVAQYDALYEKLVEPVEYHTVTLPYGQSTITFIAKTKVGNDSLIHNFTSLKKWGGFTVTFEALEPQMEAEYD